METKIKIASVKFGSDSKRIYLYSIGNLQVQSGDFVIVPVGVDGTQRIAEIVEVKDYPQESLPMPKDKLKEIIKIFDPNGEIKCPLCNKTISADECYEIEMCTEGLGPKNGVPGIANMETIKANAELCRKCCYHSYTPHYSEDDILVAHYFSSSNMPALKKDTLCGCFYCLNIFSPNEITEWIQGDAPIDKDGTAICPYCGVDSIIGQSSGYPITKDFLKRMKKHWF